MGREPRLETNFFLTGPRHTGKTTLLFRALREAGIRPAGFAVKRVYSRGRVASFRLVDLASRRAATVVKQDPQGVWRADPDGFDGVGTDAILSALAGGVLVVMDELGTYEREAVRFREAVQAALDSPTPVLGVLKETTDPFVTGVRNRADTRVVPVQASDRARAETELRAWLAALLSGPTGG